MSKRHEKLWGGREIGAGREGEEVYEKCSTVVT